MKEITLALSGGAARGAYHLGVLQFIEESDIEVKAISATSIGAIIGASWLSGVSAKEQLAIFKSKEFKKIFRFNFFRNSIYRLDSTAKIVQKLVPKKNIQDFDIPFYVTAVDLNSGQNLYFDSGDIKTLCFGSSALVPIFAPVRYNGYKLADGGFIDHIPTQPLKAFPFEIVAVNLHPICKREVNDGIMSYIKRVLYISMYRDTFDAKINSDIYITSKKLLDYSIFSFYHFDELFELGYHDAKEKFNSKL
ncbi:patatin-like phospholipase family protein [Sulfurimonas sp. HSL-1716]|uniref:patatin-like phospholipase family protein n=1 Tax=Hydrocurvibacter sulfurireducens TaxID=3131937 RepID=UPI0031F87BC3